MRYVVFDDNGVIHESSDYDDAVKAYGDTEEFDGDLIIAEVLDRRR